MPEAVRWRVGKEHLGWAFTSAFMAHQSEQIRSVIEASRASLAGYVKPQAIDRALNSALGDPEDHHAGDAFELYCFSIWLDRHQTKSGWASAALPETA